MTNKDLLKIAMPFISLTGKQWNAFVNFVDEYADKESEFYNTLQTLMINQSRIEIISDYDFYFGNENRQ